jgi:hypothetical protein
VLWHIAVGIGSKRTSRVLACRVSSLRTAGRSQRETIDIHDHIGKEEAQKSYLRTHAAAWHLASPAMSAGFNHLV